METNYRQSVYLPQLEASNEYLDFIAIELHKRGIVLQNMSSKKYQLRRENLLGLEVKNDLKLKTTGNLYIETAEKSDPANHEYVPSGIYRNDGTWLFGIGDRNIFFIFSKKMLRSLHRKIQKETIQGVFIPRQTPTSMGFCMTKGKAAMWADKVIDLDRLADNL